MYRYKYVLTVLFMFGVTGLTAMERSDSEQGGTWSVWSAVRNAADKVMKRCVDELTSPGFDDESDDDVQPVPFAVPARPVHVHESDGGSNENSSASTSSRNVSECDPPPPAVTSSSSQSRQEVTGIDGTSTDSSHDEDKGGTEESDEVLHRCDSSARVSSAHASSRSSSSRMNSQCVATVACDGEASFSQHEELVALVEQVDSNLATQVRAALGAAYLSGQLQARSEDFDSALNVRQQFGTIGQQVISNTKGLEQLIDKVERLMVRAAHHIGNQKGRVDELSRLAHDNRMVLDRHSQDIASVIEILRVLCAQVNDLKSHDPLHLLWRLVAQVLNFTNVANLQGQDVVSLAKMLMILSVMLKGAKIVPFVGSTVSPPLMLLQGVVSLMLISRGMDEGRNFLDSLPRIAGSASSSMHGYSTAVLEWFDEYALPYFKQGQLLLTEASHSSDNDSDNDSDDDGSGEFAVLALTSW